MEKATNRRVDPAGSGHSFNEIVEGLGLTQEFIDRHRDAIVESFADALLTIWRSLMAPSGSSYSNAHLFAITNKCLFLGSSVALLGSDPQLLHETMSRLGRVARRCQTDVSTLISVAVLAHLFDVVEAKVWFPETGLMTKLCKVRPRGVATNFSIVEELRQRFIGVNWMIGSEGVQILGLRS